MDREKLNALFTLMEAFKGQTRHHVDMHDQLVIVIQLTDEQRAFWDAAAQMMEPADAGS